MEAEGTAKELFWTRGWMVRASLGVLLVVAWGVASAGCRGGKEGPGDSRATEGEASPVLVHADCSTGIVPPVTKAGLTLVLAAVSSRPLDSNTWELSFRGRLTNRREALVPAARAVVSSSDDTAVVTRDRLDFAYIRPGDSVHSGDTIRIWQSGADKLDACAVSVELNTPPVFARTVARGVELGTTLEVQLEVSNAEGDPLSFRAESLPDGVSLDAETGKLTIVAEGEPRSFPIGVTVSDGVFEDSTVMDVAFYERQAANPPAEPADLPDEPIAIGFTLPGTGDVELRYDPNKKGAVVNYGSCLSRITDCAKTNNIGSGAECISGLERCADNTGGKNCCAPACLDKFDALIEAGAPVMKAIEESFLEGSCQEGLERSGR